jgi:hypothetical protein
MLSCQYQVHVVGHEQRGQFCEVFLRAGTKNLRVNDINGFFIDERIAPFSHAAREKVSVSSYVVEVAKARRTTMRHASPSSMACAN